MYACIFCWDVMLLSKWFDFLFDFLKFLLDFLQRAIGRSMQCLQKHNACRFFPHSLPKSSLACGMMHIFNNLSYILMMALDNALATSLPLRTNTAGNPRAASTFFNPVPDSCNTFGPFHMLYQVSFRSSLPLPHEALHGDHSPQSDTLQFAGHGPLSQLTVSSSLSVHAAPPCSAYRMTFLVRFQEPTPQELEQSPKADHMLVRQSTAQGWVAQLCEETKGGQT